MAVPIRTRAAALVLVVIAGLGAWRVATLARGFNDELVLRDPALARVPPVVVAPATPRLANRVILVIVDGLRLADSRRPGFDAIRAAGVDGAATSEYPTSSRPNYVSILTGVPPTASGVRVNRVRRPIRLDSIMARAQAAGLRVTTASDIGNIPPLFIAEQVDELGGLEHPQTGDLVTPATGFHWPFDEVRKADSLADLETSLARVLATPSDLVIVLAGDVDRAGHASGAASAAYRDAAGAVGAALGRLLGRLDLAHDTLIVTADHGHLERGGHGGTELDTTLVPLLATGAGIVRGSRPATARLVDVAPTIAALLGIPAPGHGHGRALVELLALDRDAARARASADATRLASLRALPDESGGPSAWQLGLVGVALVLVLGIAVLARRELAITRHAWVGVLAWCYLLLVMVAACRGRLSPSEVPALWRLQRLFAVCGVAAIAIQLVASWAVVRTASARLARANGIAVVGLATSLAITFALRGWFARPLLEVPEPAWLVVIPAVELATAVTCLTIALHLIAELVHARGRG